MASSFVIRVGLLTVLTLQNAGQAVLIKLAQMQGSRPDSFVIMLLAELVKAVVSLLLFVALEADASWAQHFHPLALKKSLKLLPTAFMFAVQNQLLFDAVQNLDPPVYQALSQLKILWAGVFSVLLLGKRLSHVQWTALLLLACGAALVQLESSMCKERSSTDSAPAQLVAGDPVRGLIMVLLASVISGMAGCYTELMLKTEKMPMWLQSAQVALASAFILGSMISYQRTSASSSQDADVERPWLEGFVPLTWAVVSVISLGGIVVVAVLRVADNVLKGISMVFALLVSSVLSRVMFATQIGLVFCVAAVIICCSVFLYQAPAAATASPPASKEARVGLAERGRSRQPV